MSRLPCDLLPNAIGSSIVTSRSTFACIAKFETHCRVELTRTERRQQFAEVFNRRYKPFLDIDLW
jgi:hypothetical protein